MLHEALFYLWNCPGDLFQMDGENVILKFLMYRGFIIKIYSNGLIRLPLAISYILGNGNCYKE